MPSAKQEIDYVELASQIDIVDLAEKCVVDAREVAGHCEVDVEEVASHIDLNDLAGYIEASEIAEHVEVSASDVACHVDMDELADHICKDSLAEKINFDYDDLARVVSHRAIAREMDAGDIAREIDADDIAIELGSDGRFIEGVADLLMKNEGFIAAIAAKVLAGLVAPHIKTEEVDEVPHGQRDTFIPDPIRTLEDAPTVLLACGHATLNADMRCTTCGAEA